MHLRRVHDIDSMALNVFLNRRANWWLLFDKLKLYLRFTNNIIQLVFTNYIRHYYYHDNDAVEDIVGGLLCWPHTEMFNLLAIWFGMHRNVVGTCEARERQSNYPPLSSTASTSVVWRTTTSVCLLGFARAHSKHPRVSPSTTAENVWKGHATGEQRHFNLRSLLDFVYNF